MTVRYFGIRHHGPGSARSLEVALDEWRPDAILVEGPPEGDDLLALAASEEMRPPVALLVHVVDRPRRASFWPFATFSPEWRAIRHGLAHGVPVRFIDLPAAVWLAPRRRESPPDEEPERPRHRDPLADLAAAAGYTDVERWWEDSVEFRGGVEHAASGPFEAIAEAMAALREEEPPVAGREAQREAAMRQNVRAAVKEDFERVAVVCGAWHVPALSAPTPMSADAITLKGLPRVKVAATWIPWTSGRLATASGYGAGITSPGWYSHLFTAPDQVVTRWFVKVARLLRDEDLPASSASLIDAVRLSEALATLRGRPLAGLDELTDATRAGLCHGSDAPMALVGDRLIVGRELGRVPPETPMVPLAQDLAREQRRLRLRAEVTSRELDLDLRKPTDLGRSHLLHRLALLDVDWGEPVAVAGKMGTFHEVWRVQWHPELAVALIEAGMWGTTVADAATVRAGHDAAGAGLSEVTGLLERCLLAELPEAVASVMGVLAERAALDTDVGHLMDALPALARALRYGDVRRTEASSITSVVDGLVVRICVGLPVATSSLDDDAAGDVVRRILGVHESLAILDRADLSAPWTATLLQLVDRAGLHGLVAGRCARLLLDGGHMDAAEAARRMAATLSVGEEPARAAAWVEGFLSGSALILLHDRALLQVVDGWLAGVADDTFTDVLPLLRRTFATFGSSERRQIGQRVRRLGSPGADRPPTDEDLDLARAELVVPVLALLLGSAEE